jgi:hypothetical protein
MKKLIVLFGLLAIVAFAPLARADFSISVNGVSCATGVGDPANPGGETGMCAFVTVSPGVTVSTLSTNGTQTAANSQQFTSTLTISNATAAPTTITIDTAANFFDTPATPPDIIDSFGYTLNETTGATTASSYTACVDQGNGLTSLTGTCKAATSITVSGAQVLSSPEGTFLLTSLHSEFGLNQRVVLTLAPGTSVDVTASQTLTSVPEPASIVMLGSILVGLATLFRKKVARQS